MKKKTVRWLSLILLIAAPMILLLTGCDEGEAPQTHTDPTVENTKAPETEEIPTQHEHSWSAWEVTMEASCRTGGTETRTCDSCSLQEDRILPIDPNAHGDGVYVDEAIAPTCTQTGLTEGSHCRFCNAVLVAQETVPVLPHEAATYEAVPPTCTESGLTEGGYCAFCSTVLVAQETVNALGHDPVVDVAVAPTCTETGLAEGSHCDRCGETLDTQDVIDSLGHAPVVDPAVDPTCTEEGVSEGSHCDRCGDILVAQETVDAMGHFAVPDFAADPTCAETGLTEGSHCDRCGHVLVAQESVDALGHDWSSWTAELAPTCTVEGTEYRTCGRCAAEETRRVDPLGHTPMEHAAVAPTCTESGTTAWSDCSVCGWVLTAQETIPALGHTEGEWIIDVEAVPGTEGSRHRDCTVCGETLTSEGYDYGSPGLTYVSNNNGTCYVSGRGTCTDSVIYIPSVSPDGDRVLRIGAGAFRDDAAITAVYISSRVRYIEQGAFAGCYNLTTLQVPFIGDSSAGSFRFLGYIFGAGNAFDNGSYVPRSLKTVEVVKHPDPTLAMCEVAERAFYKCEYLENVSLPDSVLYVRPYAFSMCSGLKSIVLSEGLTKIEGYAFNKCSSLETLTIPTTVTEMREYVFMGCSALKSLTLPFVGTMAEHGGDLSYMFGLGQSSTNMPYYLTDITLTNAATIADGAFMGFAYLVNVKVQGTATSVGAAAFKGCTALQTVELPQTVTVIGDQAFSGCTSLKTLDIPSALTTLGLSAFNGCTALTEVILPASVTEIGTYAFNGCWSLTTVDLGGTVRIGDQAFYECSKLSTLTLSPNLQTVGNYAFSGCKKIPTLVFAEGLLSVGQQAFANCTSLSELYLPVTATAVGSAIAKGCTVLESLTLPSMGNATSGYKTLGYFFGIDTTVDHRTGMPQALRRVTVLGGTHLPNNAFYNFYLLTDIILPDTLTSIGSRTMVGCSALERLSVPFIGSKPNDTGDNATLNYLFGGQTEDIAELTVTGNAPIPEGALYSWQKLTKITLSGDITSIGDYAFYSCRALTTIRFEGTVAQWQAVTKGDRWNLFAAAGLTVICDDGQVSGS